MNVQVWSIVLGLEALAAWGLALHLAKTRVPQAFWAAVAGVLLFALAWLSPEGWFAILVAGLGLAMLLAMGSIPYSQRLQPSEPSPLNPNSAEAPATHWTEAVGLATVDCLLVVDEEGNIRHANQAWADLVPEEVQSSASFLEHLADPATFAKLLATVRESGAVNGLPVEIKSRAGVRTLHLGATRLPTQPGAPELLLLRRDVAEVSRLKRDLEAKEKLLAESEQQYRKLLESVTDYVYRVEVVGGQAVRTIHGPGAQAVTGYKVSRFEHDKDLWLQMVYEEDRPLVLEQARKALSGAAVQPIEHRFVHRDGTVRWLRNTAVIHKQNGVVVSYDGLITDITERKTAEEAVQRVNDQLKLMNDELRAHAVDDALFNDLQNSLGVCNSSNEALSVLEGFGPRLFPGSSGCLYRIGAGRDFMESVCSWGELADSEVVVRVDQCWALRRSKPHGSLSDEPSVLCSHVKDLGHGYICAPVGALGEASGVLRIVLGPPPDRVDDETLGKHKAAKGSLVVKVADALSLSLANIDLREQLTNQAVRDPLTGLFNRRYLEETLNREVRRAARTSSPLSVVMFDLDRFKRFNDNHGHEAGDVALQKVGEYLVGNFRGDDVACRYGGEEFVLVMYGASREHAVARSEEARLAIAALSIPCGGRTAAKLTASFGVATYSEDGEDGAQVLQKADQALYRAKSWGRNMVVSSHQTEPPA